MFHRRPQALTQLSSGTSESLARLAALEGFSRALLVGVVPLLALKTLGSKEAVAQVYLIAALMTMLVTLNIGTLERLFERRRVVTLGGALLVVAALFLYLQQSALLSFGIGLRSAAASIFSVCMSLYIMDYIGKRELTRNESRRMQYAGISWLIGPFLGTWLFDHAFSGSPFVLSATAAAFMLCYFWVLRLGTNKVVVRAQSKAINPARSVVQFARQKKLRIAYGITLSRSCYWVALFVYGPIYVIESGLPSWMAGVLLSGVSTLLFFSPLIRRLADVAGVRRVIICGLIITATSLLCLGFIGEARPVGLVFWVLGAVGGVALDVLGNIPFMRIVKPRERTPMTTVFSTWREASELLTPLIVTATLLWFDFHYFYFILAAMHLMSALSASFLPRRL